MIGNPLIEATGITKEFSGVRVLDRVHLSIGKGEIVGVIGENGAGKSTFMKILSGIYTPTAGEISVNGRGCDIPSPIRAKELGITMIPQEFNLISTLSVFENVFLGFELRKGPVIDKKEMRSRTAGILKELKTSIDPNSRLMDLSVAEKQMVEIGKALIHDSNLLIMDEPTTVLNRNEVAILFSIMRQLKEKGVSILFVSHKLHEVKDICDRVLILRDGQQIALDSTDAFTVPDLAQNMVGRELNQIFPDKSIPPWLQKAGKKDSTPPVEMLKVENLNIRGVLEQISFTLNAGEVLGFAGLMGAGRTEVAEAVMGLRTIDSGTISIKGKPVTIRHPRNAVDHGIAYLSEDRQGRGIIRNFTIPENITLVSLSGRNGKAPSYGLSRYAPGWLDKKKEQIAADRFVGQFNIKAASIASQLQFLSGGNQQKVYLAKWMDTKPEILILDEPTRGIDVNAKMEIYQFIKDLSDRGIACLVISSELEEIIGLCHRVIVMREGRIAGELPHDRLTEKEIMFYATGIQEELTHG